MPVPILPIPPLSETDIAKFWSHVVVTGPDNCWFWRNRYGVIVDYQPVVTFRVDGKQRHFRASRIAYFLKVGVDPSPLYVCHNCPTGDDTRCLNATHFFLGTHRDNMRDMFAKGMNRPGGAPGISNSHAKKTEAEIIEIRRMFDQGEAGEHELMVLFDLSRSQINKIVRRKIWKHLPG